METYSAGVALFDYLPVLVAAIGLACLARAIGAVRPELAPMAWTAALAIALGGLCKASWKLLIALQDRRVDLLDNLLFVLLAPGFVVLAYCFHHARHAWQGGLAGNQTRLPWWPLLLWLAIPLGGAVLLSTTHAGSRLWFIWLLAITTLANWTLLGQSIIAARRGGLPTWVSVCLVYNIVATLILSALSRLPPGEASAWIQQSVNLTAQSALTLGFWRLGRRMQERD